MIISCLSWQILVSTSQTVAVGWGTYPNGKDKSKNFSPAHWNVYSFGTKIATCDHMILRLIQIDTKTRSKVHQNHRTVTAHTRVA